MQLVVNALGRHVQWSVTYLRPVAATMTKQHCRMLQVKQFHRQVQMLLLQCQTLHRDNVEQSFFLSTK